MKAWYIMQFENNLAKTGGMANNKLPFCCLYKMLYLRINKVFFFLFIFLLFHVNAYNDIAYLKCQNRSSYSSNYARDGLCLM